MKICSSCIIDNELNSIIENNRITGQCEICGKKNALVLDTNSEQFHEIQHIFTDFFNIYTPESFISDNSIKEKCIDLLDDIIYKWNIFNKYITKDNLKSIIKELLSNNDDIDINLLLNEKVVIKELYDDNFLLEHSLLYTYSWEEFIKEIKEENRFHPTTINIEYLDKFASYLVKSYKAGDIFYRGRVSTNKKFEPEELLIPPFHLRTEGRAHARGIKCLYLANNIETVLYETRSLIYDYINIATFEAIKDFNVFDFNNINNISPFSQSMNTTILAINKVHLDNIKKDINKINRRTDSVLDYLPTQYIVDFVKNIKNPIDNDCLYSGIGYSSTLSSKGYNIAMFDDSLFKCNEINLYEVNNIKYEYKKLDI